jgi:hypothetical protein
MAKAKRPVWMASKHERAGAIKQFLKYIERVGGMNPAFERLLVPIEVEQLEVEAQPALQIA